jgi:hypothetical protein
MSAVRETRSGVWREETCGACRGYGLVSDYSGGDFNGAMGCESCGEQGFVWRSPKDRLALYPGGPFVGYDPRPRSLTRDTEGER